MAAARFLVVIPAYNEEETIEEVVRRSQKHCDVCVVDDCSKDRTPEILASIPGVHVVRHQQNTHIAGAVLDGMRYALGNGYDYAVTMDAGLSHNPDELPRFLQCEPADLVIGARDPGQVQGVPLRRRVLSRCGTFLMNSALSDRNRNGPKRLRDCTSGYRRYSRRAMEVLTTATLRSRAFDFLLESLAVLSRSGCSIREVPISYKFTNSSLNWRIVREALRMWWSLK
ncbi:MAG: glycosyltransferase family 2 protein [Planctomycetota bacterium]|nr:MAG: glycosyltransferase family 2 protein [Planctomycetota bacterium]